MKNRTHILLGAVLISGLLLLSGCGATLINPGSPDSALRYGIRKPVLQELPATPTEGSETAEGGQ